MKKEDTLVNSELRRLGLLVLVVLGGQWRGKLRHGEQLIAI